MIVFVLIDVDSCNLEYMLWLLDIIWVLEGWKWDVFGGCPSWAVTFWLVKVRHVPVAAAAAAVATVVQVIFVRPMCRLHVVARSWLGSVGRLPWLVMPFWYISTIDEIVARNIVAGAFDGICLYTAR